MGLDATELLGSQQLAGVRVNPPGAYLATVSRQGGTSQGGFGGGAAGGLGGMLGSSLMAGWARKKARTQAAETPRSSAPDFAPMAFLAVTATDLALVGIDARTTARLTSVLAKVPRSRVAGVVLDTAGPLVSKPLTVTFVGGDVWILEVSAALKRHARKVAEALG
jgi:hypothetical protein